MQKNRFPAVPLITVDPFFSVWSMADNLHDESTKNWTEFYNPLMLGVVVDGVGYSMGAADKNLAQFRQKIYQKSVDVKPLSTEYVFENDLMEVKLTFTTPLLLDRLDIMSRPASYIAYEIIKKNDNVKNVEFLFSINSRCCVHTNDQTVRLGNTEYSVYCGNTEQKPLARSGDVDVIDWGYLHLCDTDAYIVSYNWLDNVIADGNVLSIDGTYNGFMDMPYIAVRKNQQKGVITVAYDSVKAVEYFNTPLDEYYKKYFKSFDDMAKAAISEYDKIKVLCDEFDKELLDEAEKYGKNYALIVSLAYRQAIAAHKLCENEKGEILFFSKECESNGCIGTLDVTYPSIPLFLKYNPELVCGMLRPIIEYAKSDMWEYDFAPHDVGQYPLANGQVYGMDGTYEENLKMQMPVEECGNMLLCLLAVEKYANEPSELFEKNKELIKKWTDYLVKYGYDPGEQLCTDDFAGHLNHNCNLSLKAILGIAAYGMLAKDDKYIQIAKDYAKKWQKDAFANHGATRLTFDNGDGWSMKYNMVWDSLFGLNLFDDEVKQREIKLYMEHLNRYGVPLDSRDDYTKIDWLMWSTCICDNKEYFDAVCESIVNMILETPDRVPLTDWYYSSTAKHVFFQNRTVVGGLFIKLI